jgi:hypothetical protein
MKNTSSPKGSAITVTSSKITRYFTYAAGEIALVVIGILIALQINNWNENKKQERVTKDNLVALMEELEFNITSIKSSIVYNDSIMVFSRRFTNSIKSGDSSFKEKSITGSLNFTTLTLQTPILDIILGANIDQETVSEQKIALLRELEDKYRDVDKMVFYLDEFWNSKITDFLIGAGLSYSNSKTLDPTITIQELDSFGYSKRQFTALLDMNIDFQETWLRTQSRALEVSESMYKELIKQFSK